jgi:hypothetical protein
LFAVRVICLSVISLRAANATLHRKLRHAKLLDRGLLIDPRCTGGASLHRRAAAGLRQHRAHAERGCRGCQRGHGTDLFASIPSNCCLLLGLVALSVSCVLRVDAHAARALGVWATDRCAPPRHSQSRFFSQAKDVVKARLAAQHEAEREREIDEAQAAEEVSFCCLSSCFVLFRSSFRGKTMSTIRLCSVHPLRSLVSPASSPSLLICLLCFATFVC